MAIAILGTKTTFMRLLEALGDSAQCVVTLDDGPDPRSRLADIRTARPDTIVAKNAKDAYRILNEAEPDVVFVAGWYWLIPNVVLSAPPQGYVGVHYSSLPAYRGAAPVVWAMMNRDPDIGYSIFRLTSGLDEGPIAAQGKVAVSRADDVGSVLDKLDHASLGELVRIAPAIERGDHRFSPQSEVGVSFGGFRLPVDGRIDWSRPADELEAFVKAQTRPYPGAFGVLDGKRVTVWAACSEPEALYDGVPGHVVRLIDGRPVIACGARTGLVLTETSADDRVRWSLSSSRFER